MGEQLTDEEIFECKKTFAIYDRDGDGTMSTRELGSAMRTMGYRPTDNELTDILNEVDTDGLGEISFPSFLTIMAKKLKEYEGEESLRLAFRVFDKHKNGLVTSSDFRYMLENLRVNVTDHEINEMIKDADKNHNGQIPYNDFITWITGK
ncbi:hypothetical protein ACF0H5_015582 [Mactra antiquata]